MLPSVRERHLGVRYRTENDCRFRTNELSEIARGDECSGLDLAFVGPGTAGVPTVLGVDHLQPSLHARFKVESEGTKVHAPLTVGADRDDRPTLVQVWGWVPDVHAELRARPGGASEHAIDRVKQIKRSGAWRVHSRFNSP